MVHIDRITTPSDSTEARSQNKPGMSSPLDDTPVMLVRPHASSPCLQRDLFLIQLSRSSRVEMRRDAGEEFHARVHLRLADLAIHPHHAGGDHVSAVRQSLAAFV